MCGSTSEATPDSIVPGERYPGGPPNPEALARPARGRAGGRAGGGKSPAKGRGKARGASRGSGAAGESDEQRYTRVKRARPTEPAPDA